MRRKQDTGHTGRVAGIYHKFLVRTGLPWTHITSGRLGKHPKAAWALLPPASPLGPRQRDEPLSQPSHPWPPVLCGRGSSLVSDKSLQTFRHPVCASAPRTEESHRNDSETATQGRPIAANLPEGRSEPLMLRKWPVGKPHPPLSSRRRALGPWGAWSPGRDTGSRAKPCQQHLPVSSRRWAREAINSREGHSRKTFAE